MEHTERTGSATTNATHTIHTIYHASKINADLPLFDTLLARPNTTDIQFSLVL